MSIRAAGTAGCAALPIMIPGDLSSATFLSSRRRPSPGSDVTVENVGLNPTRAARSTCSRRWARDIESHRRATRWASRSAGCACARRACAASRSPASWRFARSTRSRRWRWPRRCAEGDDGFADLEELRVKESDRIVAIARELRRAGVAVEERPDGFVVKGLAGAAARGRGRSQPEHDHRIAMAGAILGLSAERRDHRPRRRHRDVVPDLRRNAGRARRADLTAR